MTARSGAEAGTVRLSWETCDRHRLVTVAALMGAAAATAMGIWGLPPVDLHGPLHKVGIMDPLCGGTRAARYTIEGELADAWRYNPLGIAAVVGALLATARTALGMLRGRWLTVFIAWTPRRRTIATVVVGTLVVLLQVRQQGRADLLMEGTLTF